MALKDQWDGPDGLTQGIEDPNLRRIVESLTREVRRLRGDAEARFRAEAGRAVLLIDGSVDKPSLAFAGDTNTGFRRGDTEGRGFNVVVNAQDIVQFDSGDAALVEISGDYTNLTVASGQASLLEVNGSITAAGSTNPEVFGLQVRPSGVTTADSGSDHVLVATAAFYEPNITIDVAGVTTAATVYVADAPTEGDNNYAIYAPSGDVFFGGTILAGGMSFDDNVKLLFGTGDDASIYYDGTNLIIDPQEVGSGELIVDGPIRAQHTGTTNRGRLVTVTGTVTSDGAGAQASVLFWSPDLIMADGDTVAGAHVSIGSALGGSITTQGNSETITHVASLDLSEPGITVGSGDTVTNASTLLVRQAPTEGTNNHAIRVLSGTSDFGSGLVTGNGMVPVGTMVMWVTNTAPTNWILCRGQAVSRSTFAALFAVIGTTYGNGNGSTTFNVPDLQQRFPLGKATSGTGATLGATGGAIDHEHTVDAHSHGDGSLAVASHSHDDGTLAVASHSHGDGSLAVAAHNHGAGTLAAASHNHSIGSSTDSTFDGSDVSFTYVDDVDSNTGNAAPSVTGNTANASPDVTGSTAAASPDVTGSTGSASPDVTGSTATATPDTDGENPPFQVVNFIVFAGA